MLAFEAGREAGAGGSSCRACGARRSRSRPRARSSTCRSGWSSGAAADGTPAGIDGVLEYASDLFDEASVAALGQRLIRLLEGAVADPARALGSADDPGAAERDTILRVWNDTGAGR